MDYNLAIDFSFVVQFCFDQAIATAIEIMAAKLEENSDGFCFPSLVACGVQTPIKMQDPQSTPDGGLGSQADRPEVMAAKIRACWLPPAFPTHK
jgi:hypothetical protein